MPHHDWSEEDFDWNGLNNAIGYCMDFWMKWGRLGSWGKEKYGTFRDSPKFWDGGIHGLIYPGYAWIKYPFLYFKFDRYITQPFTKYTGLHKLGLWYQAQVYNYAIQQACKKHPHLIDEIVADLDGAELVKPGLFGKVDGKMIMDKYWTRV